MKPLRIALYVLVLLVLHDQCDSAATESQLQAAGKVLRKKCQPKSKATDEQVDNMKKGIWDDAQESKCYVYCLMISYKLVGKNDGKFDENALKMVDMLPEPRQAPILKSVENCRGTDNHDQKCDAAYYFAKCVYFDNPENYFAP